MKLLVIIVTYNAMQWAERCFNSLNTSTITPDVFVVDNGSTDGTQAYIQENYPKTIFQQSKENLGFGAANNIGLKYALENNYDYVYLLNQDAWVMTETFEKLIKISQDNPEFGLISPMQMNADLYKIDKSFCIGLFSNKNKDLINDLYNQNLKYIYETAPFIMAAHWFLTRKCIETVGGFSPTFAHYGEDNDYANRVEFHGFSVGVAPLLRVVHDRGDRIDNSKKALHLFYTGLLVSFSNPCKTNRFYKFAKMVAICCTKIIEFKTLKPILLFCKAIVHYPCIKKNRNIASKTKCAFLEHN